MSNVRIRPVERVDAQALIAANRASIDLHRPWVYPFIDQVGFDAYFGGLGALNIGLVGMDMQNGAIVGIVTLSQIVRGGFQNAYLGFYAMHGQTGRGLMTQVLRLSLGHGFGALGLHRLEANVQPGNARSLALVKRLGFRREGFSPRYLSIDGIWRDHERWAILSDEFAR